MPWTSAVQTVDATTENAPLPDSERLRREALQRSWQRDKEVSRRRLRMRWTVWALCRYGLPLLLVLAAAMAVWTWGLPHLRATLAAMAGPVGSEKVIVGPASSTPATPPVADQPPVMQTPVEGAEHGNVPPTPTGRSDASEEDPIQLRRDGDIRPSSHLEAGQASLEDTDSTNTPNPDLKPDIGLHSKEP
jgi:hypothetical protein